MEEEGICYFFRHDADGHTMVLSNSPGSHPTVPPGKLVFDENTNQTHSSAALPNGKRCSSSRPRTYTLWDHCFELPQQSLVATGAIAETMAVGSVSHKLKLPANDKLEVYEYPGAYAQRFDGITRSGGEQPASLRKIFEDNERTVKIRMEAETVPGLFIRGASYAARSSVATNSRSAGISTPTAPTCSRASSTVPVTPTIIGRGERPHLNIRITSRASRRTCRFGRYK